MEVLISPGDELRVSAGPRGSRAASPFSGTGALLNAYIFDDLRFFEGLREATDFDALYARPPLPFSEGIDALFHRRTARLEDFIRKNRVHNRVFISTERKRIFYGSAIEKNLYYRDHKFLTGEKADLTPEYDAYLKQADWDDSSLLSLGEYKNFLYTYFERGGLQEHDSQRRAGREAPFTEQSYALAKSRLANPRIKSYVLYRIADVHLNETPIDELGDFVDDFNKQCREDKYLAPINSYYAKLRKLQKGTPAPDFSFPDANGRAVSLSSFRGSLVYLDVWNSHCSPCFKEFPIYENLRGKYRGKNIVFVGISLDSDEALWKKAMAAKGVSGIQLFGNGWESQFVRDYLVYSNPRFILIDEEGKFISAKAPRPSENIEEVINPYLR